MSSTELVLDFSSNTEVNGLANQIIEQAQRQGGEAAEFAESIERILAGERDADALTQNLSNLAPLIETVLAALEDPSILDDLPPDHEPSE